MGDGKNGGVNYLDIETWCEGYLRETEFERKCLHSKKFIYKISFWNEYGTKVIISGEFITQWNKPQDGLNHARFIQRMMKTGACEVLEFKEVG